MKKFILQIIFINIILSGNVYSEEIILKCKHAFYKYVNDGQKVFTYSTSIKKKNDWHEWPKTKVQDDNKDFLIFTDAEAIIDGYEVTEKFNKIQWKGGTATNGSTTVDFKNKTRKSKATSNGKPYNASEKCKLTK